MLKATERQRSAAAAVLLAGMVAWVYAAVGSFPFMTYDDQPNLLRNPALRDGLTPESVRWAFTTASGIGWLPMTWLSHLLDVTLFGMDAGKHHLVNVALHLANSLLLYRILRRCTGRAGESWLVAALFAVHPLHVESVAWISERKDVLCTLFWFLATDAWLGYVESPRARRYAAAAGWFSLALLSKSMAVTFPFLLLLLDFWPLGRFPALPARRLLWEKAPLAALSAIACVVTLVTQGELNAVASVEEFPLLSRIANIPLAYAGYLGKTAWPSGLAIFYPHPQMRVPLLHSALAALLLAATTGGAFRLRKERPWLLAGWLWFLGTLLPVIGLVQVGAQSMADRYSYVPLVGIFLAAAREAGELAARAGRRRRIVPAAAALCLAALSVAARAQVGHWRDSVSLWRHDVGTVTENWLSLGNLGGAYADAGRDAEALPVLERAHRLKPEGAEIEYALYLSLTKLGREAEARRYFESALGRTVRNPDASNNLGMALAGAGKVDEAERFFREAIRLRPGFAEAHYNLAVALGRKGRRDEAIAHFRESLSMPATDAESHNRLGVALIRVGRPAEAVPHFRKALRRRPGFGEARFNLAVALERSGAPAEANGIYREIERENPGDADAAEGVRRTSPAGR